MIYFDTDPSWELEVADFVENIDNDTPIESGNSYDALKVMELVFKIYNDDTSFQETGNKLFKNQ